MKWNEVSMVEWDINHVEDNGQKMYPFPQKIFFKANKKLSEHQQE